MRIDCIPRSTTCHQHRLRKNSKLHDLLYVKTRQGHYAQSAVFAMGKFALRGLAQSMARELAPKGIHVAHFVIDGGVRNAEKGRVEGANRAADSYLDPDAIAQSDLHVVQQPRSAWTWEAELRPWVERF